MTETLQATTRHHLNTRVVTHDTKWIGSGGVVPTGPYFTIAIRTGFNWKNYWIQSYPVQVMKAEPTDETIRMVELADNIPIRVMIGSSWYEVW